MMVSVGGDTSVVTVADAVTCSLGGSSVPIVVSAAAIPHAGVTVTMAKKTYDTEDTEAVDPSQGITPS